MIVIDGSQGEGGGQILRTSLSLAMCLGQSVEIKNIRAGRKKPGLLRQHLACVNAAAEISKAKVQGAQLRSDHIVFEPGKLHSGHYRFAVGSAGSTTLIFQTVLPALLRTEGVSTVEFEGGTHNGMAPSYDYICGVFLPLMKTLGIQVSTELEYYGFYPAGGGSWKCRIEPLSQAVPPLRILGRGDLLKREAVVTQAHIAAHVADRQLQRVARKAAWSSDEAQTRLVRSVGAGNILSLRLHYEHVNEFIEVPGQKGVSAERIAGLALKTLKRYTQASAPVGEYLADQLLLPMALESGGVFRTLNPSLHLQTNIEIIQRFLDVNIELECLEDELYEVRVAPGKVQVQ